MYDGEAELVRQVLGSRLRPRLGVRRLVNGAGFLAPGLIAPYSVVEGLEGWNERRV